MAVGNLADGVSVGRSIEALVNASPFSGKAKTLFARTSRASREDGRESDHEMGPARGA